MMSLVVADPALLVSELHRAQIEVRIQSSSIADASLYKELRATTGRGIRTYALLGPRAEYDVANGKVTVGKDPYPSAADEFAHLADAKVETFVNPRFSQIGATGVQPGRESHASYVTIDGRVALVCTGKFSTPAFQYERNVCLKTDDRETVKALVSLHISEFDDTAPPEKRVKEEEEAAQVVVLSPDHREELSTFLSQASGPVKIRTASITTSSPYFGAIAGLGRRASVTVSASDKMSDLALVALRKVGVDVKRANFSFDGTLIYAGTRMFLGSQRLTKTSDEKCREVGLMIDLGKTEVRLPPEVMK